MRDSIIKCIEKATEKYPKLMQWMWFLSLWILGLLTAVILTSPFKLLLKIAATL